MAVPWAAPQGRFTLQFERFAVEVKSDDYFSPVMPIKIPR
jgi:hypothetical protein